MDQGFLELVKLIGNYGIGVVCLAVLIALHVYNVRVTLPSITEASRKDLMEMLASFKEELKEERSTSASIIQTQSKTNQEEQEKNRAAHSAIVQSLAQSFKEELKEERIQCHQDHEKMMGVLQEQRLILTHLGERQDAILRLTNTPLPRKDRGV